MKIFIVNGTHNQGKTTFEKMVKAIAFTRNKRIEITSTIDYIKEVATSLGWDGVKDDKSRKFLSDLKDCLTEWKDIPYQKIKDKIKQAKEKNLAAIFIDCREPEEIKRFVNDYGAITILVQRGNFEKIGNHADDDVFNYQYDIVIDNNRGLDELKEEAKIFEEIWIEGED